MRKISLKRAAEMKHYTRVKKELEKELKASGKWKCFFSDIAFPDDMTWKDVTWHHLIGRDGDLFTSKEFLVPVIDHYHTGDEGYHNKPLSHLRTLWWWDGFMTRLHEKAPDLWMSIKIKHVD